MAENGTHITRAELAAHIARIDDKLANVPTRFEVRFLIVVAFVAGSFMPAADVARAALEMIP